MPINVFIIQILGVLRLLYLLIVELLIVTRDRKRNDTLGVRDKIGTRHANRFQRVERKFRQ